MSRNKETTRQDRAEALSNVRIYELREGVFALHCENENGEPRKRILKPDELYSSSPDMKYRPHVVGKYMRRLAMENEEARSLLYSGIRKKETEYAERADDAREKANSLNNAYWEI
jgi:hypothetical protein